MFQQGIQFSEMDVDINYQITPEKLKERKYELITMRSKFDKENNLTIIESLFKHNSGFVIYLSKNDEEWYVKILHTPQQLNEIILFLTTLNRNEKHRFRSTTRNGSK
jgi:hypothetical protein